LAYLRSALLPSLLPADQIKGDYRPAASELKDSISNALLSPGKPNLKYAAVRTVRSAAPEIAKESPAELYKLVRTIELVTFDDLIGKFASQAG